MSFLPIPSVWINGGKPTKQELFQYIQANLDDHESRLSDLEAFVSATQPMGFDISDSVEVGDGVAYMRVPYAMTITGVKLAIGKRGDSGTVSVDLQRDAGGGFASVLTGNVEADETDGDQFVANAPGLAITSIPAGAWFRLDIDSMQPGLESGQLLIEHTVST